MIMSVRKTSIKDCIEIFFDHFDDNRGTLVKLLSSAEYSKCNIDSVPVEELLVTSRKNVLRGMHFQLPPRVQTKQVMCISGKIADAIFDLRLGSPSYGKYEIIELSSVKNNMLSIPPGVAQGYCVMEDSSMVLYRIYGSQFSNDCDSGLKWNSLGIKWPVVNPVISQRDSLLADFHDFSTPFEYDS